MDYSVEAQAKQTLSFQLAIWSWCFVTVIETLTKTDVVLAAYDVHLRALEGPATLQLFS